jgi:hypothetical protein
MRAHQAKPWNIRTLIGIGVRLLRSRQLTQGKVDGRVFSLMQNVELDRVTRRKTADGTGELAGSLIDWPFTAVMISPDGGHVLNRSLRPANYLVRG